MRADVDCACKLKPVLENLDHDLLPPKFLFDELLVEAILKVHHEENPKFENPLLGFL